MHNPEEDPILNSALRRLHVVVDGAIHNLLQAIPAETPAQIESPRVITNIVNLEERRQQAGVDAQKRMEQEALASLYDINNNSQINSINQTGGTYRAY